MLQAKGLSVVAKGAHSLGLSVMIFSGYTKSELDLLRLPGAKQLLRYTDVLVDGPYDANLPDHMRSWVGSSNQKFHYLTERYDSRIERENIEREVEIHIELDGSVFVNGWPEKIYK